MAVAFGGKGGQFEAGRGGRSSHHGPGPESRHRLRIVPRDTGANGVCDWVRQEPRERPGHLHRVVTEAMTIRETSFFRDVQSFRLLRDRVIPRIIEARAKQRTLHLWSAASSTGQEAYSLAILLREYFPQLEDWRVEIVGTDISQLACDYARLGHYSLLEINRGLPARFLLRYFECVGDEWRVIEEVRRMVVFERGNLCEPPAVQQPSGRMKFDVVLLRNVLLYFAEEDRVRVLRQVYDRMRWGSALLLGNAEQAEDSSDRFRVEFDRDCYFYRPIFVR